MDVSLIARSLMDTGIDHLIGKMEVSGNYNPYLQEDDYNLTSW